MRGLQIVTRSRARKRVPSAVARKCGDKCAEAREAEHVSQGKVDPCHFVDIEFRLHGNVDDSECRHTLGKCDRACRHLLWYPGVSKPIARRPETLRIAPTHKLGQSSEHRFDTGPELG